MVVIVVTSIIAAADTMFLAAVFVESRKLEAVSDAGTVACQLMLSWCLIDAATMPIDAVMMQIDIVAMLIYAKIFFNCCFGGIAVATFSGRQSICGEYDCNFVSVRLHCRFHGNNLLLYFL